MQPPTLLLAVLLAAASAACGADDTSPEATAVIDPGDGGTYVPRIDPASFVDVVDNRYFPLLAGSRWVYEGTTDGDVERVEITVTGEHKTVMGIHATVVRDSVYVDGALVEDTFDWFAQDGEGNVWYLGEDSTDYDGGAVVSTEGSWEAGVDGAVPGIVMPADPQVGDAFRQEFLPGVAEDLGEVIDTGGATAVPAGSFDDVVTTEDWTPLDPT